MLASTFELGETQRAFSKNIILMIVSELERA